MQFENSFTVPLPPAQAWKVLMDVKRIAPCMPGAELTEVVDDTHFKGRIAVRLGPVALTFAGTVALLDVDDVQHRATIKAQGADAKGRGGAQAQAAFRIEAAPEGSLIVVATDLTLSGSVAQYGRGVGIIQSTANEIIRQFSACLKSELAKQQAAPVLSSAPDDERRETVARPPMRAAKPISGFALMWSVMLSSIRKMFGNRG